MCIRNCVYTQNIYVKMINYIPINVCTQIISKTIYKYIHVFCYKYDSERHLLCTPETITECSCYP